MADNSAMPLAEEGTEPGIEEQFEASMRAARVTGGEYGLPAGRVARIALGLIEEHGLIGATALIGGLFTMISERATQIRDGLADQPDEESDTLVSDLIYLSGVIDTAETGSAAAHVIFQRLAQRMNDHLRSEKVTNAAG